VLVESVPDAAQLRDHWWLRPGWAPDTTMLAWHLTFEGEDALHRAAVDAQRALAGIEVLDPVPPEWLHLSLVTFGARADVTDDCVRQAINAAHEHTSALESLELAFTRTVVLAESVVLSPDDSPGLHSLRSALQESVRQVRGAGAPADPAGFVPHVSVAYANGPARGSDVVTALQSAALPDVHSVRPTLTLADMRRDGRLYRWHPVSAFPL
jgi:2'-5' RNA ligase